MGRPIDDTCYAAAVMYKYAFPIHNGASCSDAVAIRESAEAVAVSEQSSDDFALGAAQLTRGLALINQPGPQTRRGSGLVEPLSPHRAEATSVGGLGAVGQHRAGTGEGRSRRRRRCRSRLARSNVDCLFESGDMISRGPAMTVLVEALLRRGTQLDLAEARSAMDRLAAVPTDPGFVLHELPLLRMRACWRGHTAMKSAIATSRTSTARWPMTLGSKGTWRSQPRCDRVRPLDAEGLSVSLFVSTSAR